MAAYGVIHLRPFDQAVSELAIRSPGQAAYLRQF